MYLTVKQQRALILDYARALTESQEDRFMARLSGYDNRPRRDLVSWTWNEVSALNRQVYSFLMTHQFSQSIIEELSPPLAIHCVWYGEYNVMAVSYTHLTLPTKA